MKLDCMFFEWDCCCESHSIFRPPQSTKLPCAEFQARGIVLKWCSTSLHHCQSRHCESWNSLQSSSGSSSRTTLILTSAAASSRCSLAEEAIISTTASWTPVFTMAAVGDDCYFFYNSTCAKVSLCNYYLFWYSACTCMIVIFNSLHR